MKKRSKKHGKHMEKKKRVHNSCCQNKGTVILSITCQSNLICTNCIEVEADNIDHSNIDLECLLCYFLKPVYMYVQVGLSIYGLLFLTALLLSSDNYNVSILVTGTYYWTSNNIHPPVGMKG